MKYYHVIVHTPFVGEEADVYISAIDDHNLSCKAYNATNENGMKWYDEEDWLERWGFDKDADDYDAVCDEYYAQCGWRLIGMITEEEYNKLNAEGEWCI